jgi:flagellar motor switch/type III secretory pathway protein FliN
MAMAAEAPARAKETATGQVLGEAGASPANSGEGGKRETDAEEDARWRPVLHLPCEFFVDLPVPGFTIADLLRLRAGSLINAQWRVGQDVPLWVNGALIGWGEFEVMGNHLAVRLMELS